jgi:hypothetical protein
MEFVPLIALALLSAPAGSGEADDGAALGALSAPVKIRPSEKIALLQAELGRAHERESASSDRERGYLQQLADKTAIVGFTTEKLVRAEVEAKALASELKLKEQTLKQKDEQIAKHIGAQMVLLLLLFLSAGTAIIALVFAGKSYFLLKRLPANGKR